MKEPTLTGPCFYCAFLEDGSLSDSFRKMNPSAKKIASEATAILIVPPASLTAAMTAEPRKLAPFEKIS